MIPIQTTARAVLTLVATSVLVACANSAIDTNIAAAHDTVRNRASVDFTWLATDAARSQAREDVATALRHPITEDDAVRIALSFSPALQAALFDSAAASAEATRSARLPNPVFAFERLASGSGASHVEVTRALTLPLLDLLLLPTRARIADATQQRLRLQLAIDVLRSAQVARFAWVDAVAARQSAQYAARVHDAAEAGAELARRMEAAGNFSALQRAREEALAGDALSDVAQARRAQRDTREALVRALGLDDAQASAMTLPEQLPAVPAVSAASGGCAGCAGPDSPIAADTSPAGATQAQAALDGRLDLQLARARLLAVARAQGLTRVTGIVDGLEIGPSRRDETGLANERGLQLSVPLPVFDSGDAARAGAAAIYQAALARTAALASDAASQLRSAQDDVRQSRTLAIALRDRIVPLHATIVGENLLRYNGMLASAFDLLADARAQARAVQQALAAQHDFWRADAALQAATLGIPSPASVRTLAADSTFAAAQEAQ